MDLLNQFRIYLRAHNKSEITIKNYCSDIRRFVDWFEAHTKQSFIAESVTSSTIQEYRTFLSSTLDHRSAKRHSSSLNQFFIFLVQSKILPANNQLTATETEQQAKGIESLLHTRDFRSYLLDLKCSQLTIKNYLADLRQFTEWTMIVLAITNFTNEKEFFRSLNKELLNTYKERLLTEKQLSPVSINRKLSSLRSYLKFASKYGLIDQKISVGNTNLLPEDEMPDNKTYAALAEASSVSEDQIGHNALLTYSSFPPLRMWQKSQALGKKIADIAIVTPLAETILICQKMLWIASGGRVFYHFAKKPLKRIGMDSLIVDSFGKSFFAPLSLSFASLPLHKRLYLTILHKRPIWYKRYHTYAIAHYVHFGILGIVVIVMGSVLYQRISPSLNSRVLGTQIANSGRTLEFRGLLLDNNSKPISEKTALRFAIYDDKIASGSSLLWQDTQVVTPDTQGNFSISIGSTTSIPNDIFSSGKGLYLGIAIQNSSELTPRQSIPNVQLAQDAHRVGGLLPITADNAASQNVLLALDSAGNLTIGKSSPVFQATDGSFTLRAQSLLLSSLPGSNGSIQLAPDGLGIVDIIKPIQNTSSFGSQSDTAGAVEVADAFAVLATTSGQSAFTINQNGGGPLISASSSGIAKFTVDQTGAGYFASNLTVNGTDVLSDNFAISLFNRKTQILNIGGEAIAVTIGSQSGTTTIRTPSTSLQGNLTLSGQTGTIYTGDNAGISFAGNGNHSIKAESGSLLLASHLQVGRDLNIVPESSSGINNLGSATNPFDTLYVNNIISSALNGQTAYWAYQDGVVRPISTTNDIAIGGIATSSAAWQVFGSGSNTGTASSSGNLTFTGITTNITQLNGGILTFRTSPGGESQLNPQLTISSTGIGIGTTNPEFRLDLQDTRNTTAAAMFTNLSTGANAGVLALKVGASTPGLSNYFTTFLNGRGEVVGKISGNGLNGVAYSTSGSDFAEYFRKHDPAEHFVAGNIVCLHTKGGVTKCSPSETSIIGVVSDRPAFVGNATHENDSGYVLVGLQGQVPVLTTDENGSIQANDALTFSSIPGVAAKAVEPTQIVGTALEAKQDVSERVNTYIKASWYDPTPRILSSQGDLQFSLQKQQSEDDSSYNVVATDGSILKQLGNFSDALIGNLAVGMIHTKELIVKGALSTESLLTSVIETNSLFAASKITSPLGEFGKIGVTVISPLSDKDGLSLVFSGSTIAVIDPVSSNAALTIDREGNASFSGTLSAQNISVKEDASIGGTLRVGRLIADSIEGISTSSATYITHVTNIYASPASTLTPSPTPSTHLATAENTTEYTPPLPGAELATSFAEGTSLEGLDGTGAFTMDFASITHGLMVFGPASFADIATSGQIAIGGNLILADAAINTLGRDLELQSLRQGKLSVMGGLFTIDTEGNLVAKGNATFAKDVTVQGTLSARIIAPIPDEDLVVTLRSKESPETQHKTDQAFVIKDSSGSAKFRVSNIGDLVASGSARFQKLMTNDLNLIRGAQADTSTSHTIASSSAGTATITKGLRERTIVSPYVSENSLIYLTPTSDTYGVTPYVARQTAEDPNDDKKQGSFTIQITRPVSGNIYLNWWIIN